MFCIRFVARYIHTFVYSMNATYVHAHNYGPAWPIVCGMNQYVGIYYTIYLSGAKAVIYVLQYVPETHNCDKTQDFMQWEIHLFVAV